MPGEVRALCRTPSDSGSVLAILRSPQHWCGRFTPVDIRYFVILKSWKALLLLASLSLGENPTHKEVVNQNRGFIRSASEHALILP
jgi:hypothetical protein